MTVLVVDDEPAIRQVLLSTLKKAGYDAETASDGPEALQRLRKGDVDVMLCDIRMPGMEGIEVIKRAREMGLETIFLMMTAHASIDTAILAMKAGAYDYLTKPLHKENLLLRLRQIANIIGLRDQNRTLRSLVQEGEQEKCRPISAAMMDLDRMVRKAAPSDYTVLITGESGSGKGVLARQMHRRSRRSTALFVPVNCGAIPENLLESEFFGHVKGAFTGADKIKKGLFLEADKGTLFLDEIGELPLHLQVKLLHALEEKQVRPVGSEQSKPVDVRIIAATNRSLEDKVAAGSFREDLYFRLNVFHIHIPPLRQRRDDIPPLLNYFLERGGRREGRAGGFVLDGEAEAALKAYDWPGNVREMENVMERAMILADEGMIGLSELPRHFEPPASSEGPGVKFSSGAEGGTLRERLRAMEARIILEAIEQAGGDRKLAAKQLGIGLSSLYRKLEQADLPDVLT
ncbi:MAG: sigma-54-dependent Fis family transcriptional regulator [Magnetococcales bacterium]|nr:sigma-54-dependent Fis family transcriptional regulator [Magnetococcales bacterium]